LSHGERQQRQAQGLTSTTTNSGIAFSSKYAHCLLFVNGALLLLDVVDGALGQVLPLGQACGVQQDKQCRNAPSQADKGRHHEEGPQR
jgi:hypothetical protein